MQIFLEWSCTKEHIQVVQESKRFFLKPVHGSINGSDHTVLCGTHKHIRAYDTH